ncbi:hypothetical protein PMAC_000610 [Pneumocystis sp. 'macacae']|nr:hypothetical protein PMAC_000610 [Pneumocystis sp. 'macacae']
MFSRIFIRRRITAQRFLSTKHRFYSTQDSSHDAFILEQEAVKEHARKTADLWRKISIFVCIPALLLSGANALQLCRLFGFVFFIEKIDLRHYEHLSHILEERENDPTPEYSLINIDSDQNIRNKKFFWGDGDKTLFWNDRVNKHKVSE